MPDQTVLTVHMISKLPHLILAAQTGADDLYVLPLALVYNMHTPLGGAVAADTMILEFQIWCNVVGGIVKSFRSWSSMHTMISQCTT